MTQHMWQIDTILRTAEGLDRSAAMAHYLALGNPQGFERAILWMLNGVALYVQQFEADGSSLKNDRCMRDALLEALRTIDCQLNTAIGRLDKSTMSQAVEYLRSHIGGET